MVVEGDSTYISDKAGYNQSGKIIEILGQLRLTFVSAMMHNDYSNAIKTIKNVHNIIAAKVTQTDSDIIDEGTMEVESKLPLADITYLFNGAKYYKNPQLRTEIEWSIHKLYRKLERLQDKYGYGMITQDDPRMAVLQR